MGKILVLLIVWVLSSVTLSHAQITGTGYGANQEQAQIEAFADLAAQISVDVSSRSEFIETEIMGKGYSENFA